MQMPEATKQGCDADFLERLDVVLHALCQPLTALQCRLALAEMNGDREAMVFAIRDALLECGRVNTAVEAMREMLVQATSQTVEKLNEDERER
jgi:hypothetical protein